MGKDIKATNVQNAGLVVELRMNAYYYSFDKTGVTEIDRILSAVACAGKAFHHTSQWNEEAFPYPGHEGENPVNWIKNAANDAAQKIEQLSALLLRYRNEVPLGNQPHMIAHIVDEVLGITPNAGDKNAKTHINV